MRWRHRVVAATETTTTIELRDTVQEGRLHTLTLDTGAYHRWLRGEAVQVAFPQLDRGEREILITGIGPQSWAEVVGTPDEAPEEGEEPVSALDDGSPFLPDDE